MTRVSVTATTYQFNEGGRLGGWALCTINDATGELTITSDWGNWSYLWSPNPHNMGAATLTHFLGVNRTSGTPRTDVDYFAMKLLGKKGAHRFSADKTTAHFHKVICERRLASAQGMWGFGREARLFTKGIARNLWDELVSLANDFSPYCDGAETLYTERFLQIDNHELISEEPWEEMQHEMSPEWTILDETILPALAKACYARVTESPTYQQLHADFLVAREKRDAEYAAQRAAPTT